MSKETSREIERINVLGVGISTLDMPRAVKEVLEGADREGFSGYVTVTGVHGVMESQRDVELKRIHNRSYLSTPDGMPMVWMAHWNGHDSVGRVYGPDLMIEVVLASAGSGRGHFFWGGNQGVAAELGERMQKRFPGTRVVGVECPPFRELTDREERDLVEQLQETRPHFFWVGLSTPKQERFMHGFLARHPDLCAGWDHGLMMIGVGAAFDFHTGRVNQAPRWMQRRGLEWLFRLCQEPRRLWRRYSINNAGFIFAILPQLMDLKKYPLEK
ncbi:MAG: WecB/TagA/CpsF family glycosyltransferase [Verrucomicrobiota bacterium]|nr:WecB/TagA/CpsF family glycosyltransferase [Verrucomicrobiota bacterium]